MPDLKVKTRIVIRNSDKTSFETSNLVLLKGELAVELDSSGNGKFKVGDGIKTYTQLPYINLTPTEIDTKLNDFVKAINVSNRHVTYTKGDNSVTEFDVVYKNEELGHGYGVCETSEGTDYEVAIDDFILKLGGIIVVKFDNDVPAEATLNVSETGAKPIYCFGAAVTTGFIKANDTVTFIYDGTNYQVISVVAASNNNIVVGSNKPAYPCTWIETDV